MIIVWRVTEHCNLACPFCAYDRTVDRPRRQADPAQVSTFAPAIAEYQAATRDPVLVSWIGGEPLRWAPLTALTLAYRTLGLRVSTTTNGTPLASAAIRTHVLENYAELTVSIDALGLRHDALRGGPGLFAQVEASVAALVQERATTGARLKLRANVVLLRSTIEHFAELATVLADWGFDEITFNALGGRDRPEFFPTNRLLPTQLKAFAGALPDVRAQLAARGVRLAGSADYVERLHRGARNEPLAIQDCGPGESFLFIDEAGRVAPCSFTADDYGVPLSGLASVADVMRLPLTYALARRERRAIACEDCQSTHVFSKFAHAHGS